MKSGNLNFLEPSGPLQACNGTALPLTPYIISLHLKGTEIRRCIFRFVSFLYKMLIKMKPNYFRFSLLNINVRRTWALTNFSFNHERVSCCENYLSRNLADTWKYLNLTSSHSFENSATTRKPHSGCGRNTEVSSLHRLLIEGTRWSAMVNRAFYKAKQNLIYNDKCGCFVKDVSVLYLIYTNVHVTQ